MFGFINSLTFTPVLLDPRIGAFTVVYIQQNVTATPAEVKTTTVEVQAVLESTNDDARELLKNFGGG